MECGEYRLVYLFECISSNYKNILAQTKKNKPLLAVLIDPDKFDLNVVIAANNIAQLFFVGGSVLKNGELENCISKIKKHTKLPVIIFPGDKNQLDKRADALLLLSLISGRNPDYLIGKHVEVARRVKLSKQEVISTGYILVEGGKKSTTEKVSKTKSLAKNDIAKIVDTAIAGELLGMKLIYLEAGSGASEQINSKIISDVKKQISLPLIVGGGINTIDKVKSVIKSGADIIVIGNALEKNISLLEDIKKCFK